MGRRGKGQRRLLIGKFRSCGGRPAQPATPSPLSAAPANAPAGSALSVRTAPGRFCTSTVLLTRLTMPPSNTSNAHSSNDMPGGLEIDKSKTRRKWCHRWQGQLHITSPGSPAIPSLTLACTIYNRHRRRHQASPGREVCGQQSAEADAPELQLGANRDAGGDIVHVD